MRPVLRHTGSTGSSTNNIKRPARPSLEALEPRQLLSGTVFAAVSGGNLMIVGDVAANFIVIDQAGLSPDQVRISGVRGTAINDAAAPVVFSGITGSVEIRMGAGRDKVAMNNVSLPGNVVVRGQRRLTLNSVHIAQTLQVFSRPITRLTDTTIGGDLRIEPWTNGGNVALQSVQVQGKTFITTGEESNTITIDDSIFQRAVNVQTGHGRDLVQIDTHGDPLGKATRFRGPVSISLGESDDTLQVGVAGESGNRAVFYKKVLFDGGPQFDTLLNADNNAFRQPEQVTIINFETLDITAPTVISTDPVTDAGSVAANTIIAATFSEAMDPTTATAGNVFVTDLAFVLISGTVTSAGNTMTFTPDAPLASATTYYVTVGTGVKDMAGNAMDSNFVWSFTTAAELDTIAPTVISTNPANDATSVAANTPIAATFSEAMAPTTTIAGNVTVTDPSLAMFNGTVTSAGNTMTFTPDFPLASGTTYTVTVSTGVKDLAGNAMASNFVWSFTTAAELDTIAPTVISTNPANDATSVAANTPIAATFSEAMDPTTTIAGNVTVTDPSLAMFNGTVAYAGNTMTFTPDFPLADGTMYTVTVTTGVKDLAGNAMASNFVWSFTTADTIAPTVTSTNPANDATSVAANTPIAATFSEAMDPTTTIASNVTVTDPALVLISGTVAYAGNTMTFTPDAPLADGTTYTVTVTTGVKDLAGNAMAGNFVWSFTTAAALDTTAPTVVSTSPATDAANVPANTTIAATFSEAMDSTTTIAGNVTVTDPALVLISGTVAYAGNTMTFTPDAPLADGTTYTVTVTTGVKDLAGNAIASNFVWSFTTAAALDTIAPTVTSISPINGKTNVAINHTVAATFSEPMDPLTLTGNFTVRDPANNPVAGAVLYDAPSNTITFTPTGYFAPSTTFAATITSGVKDLAGNAMVGNFGWTFTTGTQIAQASINLGAAGAFAVMATAAISTTGIVHIDGDVGLHPGTSQGVLPSDLTGNIHVNDQAIIDAQAALLAAYNDAVSRSVTPVSLPGNMGGLTFTPGLYTNSTSVLISGAGPSNNVTLDAEGDPNAIFIFQMGSTLTTGPASQVILTNGAKASNVFWQVGSSATVDTTTIFKGNILAAVTITVNTGSVVEGRLLAGTGGAGSVTINGSTVSVPAV